MSALTLAPRRWYSWDFFLFDGSRELADLRVSSWREKGVLSVEGVDYSVFRESSWGDFVLEHAGTTLARATKPSAFHRLFEIRYMERSYTLKAKSTFGRSYVLLDGSTEIGTLELESWWTRRATAHLPDDWPMPIKSFAVWLAIVMWKRDAS
jgi:hypothetical protein